MNDWLNYKGSGSIRANANTLEHAASIPNGRKINSIRGNAKDAAAKVRDENLYDYINKELDALYNDLQAQSNKVSRVAADLNSFMNAAHRLKASSVIAMVGLTSAENKCQSISSKIDSFSGSSLQKTALRNKFNSMVNNLRSKYDALESNPVNNIDLDTFDSLINEINNNRGKNYR